MMLVFAYVDIFVMYRADLRADIESGEIAGFTIGEGFLFATTLYVAIPSVMVFLVLVLRPGINRIVNVVLSALYALTIVASAIGEWYYFVFGSAIELVQLAAIAYLAWNWPKETLPVAR
jgi:hypothetical protein